MNTNHGAPLMGVETVAQGKFLRLVRAGHWEYAERTRASGIVVIVPFVDPAAERLPSPRR